jgi:hypothetical protein
MGFDAPTPFTGHATRSVPQSWDAELVGEAIVQGFATLARMPQSAGPRAPGGNWPQTMVEFSDQVGWAGMDPLEKKMREEAANRGRVPQPTREEIQRMEMAFDWLRELHQQDTEMAAMVTLWALRTVQDRSIKRLCIEKDWPSRTFWRKRAKALMWLAALLNAKAVPVF